MISITMNDSRDLILFVPKEIICKDNNGVMSEILCTINSRDLQRISDKSGMDIIFHATPLEIISLGLYSVPVFRNGADCNKKMWVVIDPSTR